MHCSTNKSKCPAGNPACPSFYRDHLTNFLPRSSNQSAVLKPACLTCKLREAMHTRKSRLSTRLVKGQATMFPRRLDRCGPQFRSQPGVLCALLIVIFTGAFAVGCGGGTVYGSTTAPPANPMPPTSTGISIVNSFSPNAVTISTSEGAPYGNCDFWTQTAASCSGETN